jgi:hypothetical protein
MTSKRRGGQSRMRKQADEAQRDQKRQEMLFLRYERLLVKQARERASQVLGKQPLSTVDPELFALGPRMRPERNEDRVYDDVATEVAGLLLIAEREERQAKEAES